MLYKPHENNNNILFLVCTHFLGCFVLGIVTGVIIQHFGPKICGIVGAILFSTGLITSSFASSTTHLLITFSVLSGKWYIFVVHVYVIVEMEMT